ncbi:Putative Thioredoxin domain-containing protein [Septoria linicola]|uniref:Thioredoxin domain-containing protein n=1 Tax=Septoria linicola TaxID=215465 RepID=A0A9Q9ANH9_9PEZI|nr:Putative Thioredoxin domain-containing protein [Septoria linicola]
MAAQVGKQAPPFNCTAVVDGKLKEVTLDAWSFICPTEIKAFSSRLEEFLYARSCAVVFASTDSEHCLKAWNAASQNEGGLGGVHVPLVSDCNHKLSRDYGVLIEEQGVAQRALFIIDPKGRIRGSTINDADVGRSVDEALRVLDALAFKDEFGEGCPVDWKKGDKGIDYKAETTIEGAIEVKKSWSEWARPKLQRAWSGASGVSTFSSTPPTSRPTYERSISHSGNHSPLVSPGMRASHASLQAQMEEALLQQRMENMNAAMQNQSVGMAV